MRQKNNNSKDDGQVVLLSIRVHTKHITSILFLELELLPFPVIFENGDKHSPYVLSQL